jgi:D-sedoheptulose 7-phosphate isomerase
MNKKNQIFEINKILNSSLKVIKDLDSISDEINQSIKQIIKCIENGKKIILFGNGGSAADAQHIAAELIGRFNLERKSYPAISLTSNSSVITALANDYSFDVSFSRQCECLVNNDDIVIGISTSGNSTNVKNALMVSKKKGALTIGLLGNRGGSIKKITDIAIIVNSNSTPRIQEAHRLIYHIICEIVEKELGK